MKLFLGALAILGVGTASATNRWQFGFRGHQLDCQPGEIMTGMCGSGYKANCRDDRGIWHYYGIRCSELGEVVPMTECVRSWSRYGRYASCPASHPVAAGGCGSGKGAHCSANHNGIQCCRKDDVQMDTDNCQTVNGNYGERATCPYGFAINKQCGSGMYRDCWGSLTRLNCCKVDHVRRTIEKMVFHQDQVRVITDKPLGSDKFDVVNDNGGRDGCPDQSTTVSHHESLTDSESFTRTAGLDVRAGVTVTGTFPFVSVAGNVEFTDSRSKTWGTNQSKTSAITIQDVCSASCNYKATCQYFVIKTEVKVPFTIIWSDGKTTEGVYDDVQYVNGRSEIVHTPLYPAASGSD